MRIQDKDIYHGSALTQIVEWESYKSINKINHKQGHYQINVNQRILIKHTKADSENGRWRFTLQPCELEVLRDDHRGSFRVFLCLICGTSTVCVLSYVDLKEVIDVEEDKNQWIAVEIPADGASMRVRGSAGDLSHVVAHNDFPRKLFG